MKPEMVVRSLVHRAGFRYRLHARELPGKPDLVFRTRRKVIFVHGCFWHQHAGCIDSHLPKSNIGYWRPKLERNVQRDREVRRQLIESGWSVLSVWECETRDPQRLQLTLIRFLTDAGAR